MKIRLATERDREDIIRLWSEAFSDSSSYINFYLDHCLDKVHCVLLTENDVVIGMVHLLPCRIFPDQKALYWYAACIAKSERGKGYFRHFATNLLQETKKRGFASLCVPANGLADMYRGLGFSRDFYCEKLYFNKKNENQANNRFSEAKSADFSILQYQAGDSVWDLSSTEYAILEAKHCGGAALTCILQNNKKVFLVLKTDDGFVVDHHNLAKEEISLIADELMNYLCCEKITFIVRGTKDFAGLSDCDLVGEASKLTLTLI